MTTTVSYSCKFMKNHEKFMKNLINVSKEKVSEKSILVAKKTKKWTRKPNLNLIK